MTLKMTKPTGTRLQPLRCLNCRLNLPAEIDEIAWVCPQCGQAQMLQNGQQLVETTINYHAKTVKDSPGHPFWIVEGSIHMERYTFWGINNIEDAATFWKKPRKFYIAAFDLPIENIIQWGKYYLQKPLRLRPGIRSDFLPITLALEDVQAVADIIVVGIEASRPDKLKEINFTLSLSNPELWILP